MNTEAVIKSLARIGVSIRRLDIGLFFLGTLCAHGTCAIAQGAESSADEGNHADSSSYRGGVIRIGTFAIADINSRIYYGPSDFPITVPIDVEEDLGFKDSLLAFRGGLSYRFSKHNAMSVGYYKFDLEGVRRLERTVEVGDSIFDIDLDVTSRYEEKILKMAYDFIFHDEGRVLLSISPGLHLSSVDFSIGALSSLPSSGVSEDASVTAPLPMLGGRMKYRLTPKWSMMLESDIFFLTTSDLSGSLTDSSIMFEYQTDSAFGFGVGLNRISLDLDIIDKGRRWDWQSVYSGAYMYVAYKF